MTLDLDHAPSVCAPSYKEKTCQYVFEKIDIKKAETLEKPVGVQKHDCSYIPWIENMKTPLPIWVMQTCTS
jgi:hypothetical protein